VLGPECVIIPVLTSLRSSSPGTGPDVLVYYNAETREAPFLQDTIKDEVCRTPTLRSQAYPKIALNYLT